MRKIVLYIAASLNGKIAKPDGNVDWLKKIPNPDNSDFGYKTFYESVDTTIQGFSTFKQILDWGIEFPYKATTNYVMTRKKDQKDTKYVSFINDNHAEFVKELKKREGRNIWLIGGGKLNTMLLNENLIDEMRVFIMPIILSGGIEIFELVPSETKLKLIDFKSYTNGVLELRYSLDYS